MRNTTLRFILIVSGVSLPMLSAFVWWLLGYGPWIGTSIDISNQKSLFTLMALQGFSTGVSTSALCLWAAHNLKPLSFISAINLSRYCLFGIVSCLISFVFSFFETAMQSMVFEERLFFGFDSFAYSFQFLIYGVAGAATLLFARLQLKQKLAGETIQEPTLADTFS